MRRLIDRFDALQRRLLGVYEFTSLPECILRLQQTHSSRDLPLPNGTVHRGEPVLLLHLWNERIPVIPSDGVDLSWAVQITRRFIHSMHLVACTMQAQPALAEVRALGAASVLLALSTHPDGGGLMQRLGFTIFPYPGKLGRFGEFWENLYTWGLMWTYNPASLRGRRLLEMHRLEMWITADDFLRRYSKYDKTDRHG